MKKYIVFCPMDLQISATRPEDLSAIFEVYDDAIAYQKTAGNNHWFGFDPEFILNEIASGRHYKILADGNIVATFCLTTSDPTIWRDSDEVAAVYIHRIAIRQSFRGNNVVKHIIDWTRGFARENNLDQIRIDTGAGNDRLINYYISHGFTYIGDTTIDYSPGMPLHYKDGLFALLEMPV